MGILERFSLRGKKALVTGGARGLGRAHCFALAEAGADVCVADLDEAQARATAEEIAAACGVRAVPVRADVSDEESVDALFEVVLSGFGDLDVCVANAGIFLGGDALTMPLADWKRTLDVDLTGVFLTCRGAGRIMVPRGKGSIITIASMNGHVAASASSCSYCACKAAVLNLTRALAHEWGRSGVRVNSISPGNIYTDMLNADCAAEEHVRRWEDRTAIGRLGLPEELQSAILYLACDASSFTTGADLIVDGGHTSI